VLIQRSADAPFDVTFMSDHPINPKTPAKTAPARFLTLQGASGAGDQTRHFGWFTIRNT
jgi:hypothetical protein